MVIVAGNIRKNSGRSSEYNLMTNRNVFRMTIKMSQMSEKSCLKVGKRSPESRRMAQNKTTIGYNVLF
jgi:hypothetical protein